MSNDENIPDEQLELDFDAFLKRNISSDLFYWTQEELEEWPKKVSEILNKKEREDNKEIKTILWKMNPNLINDEKIKIMNKFIYIFSRYLFNKNSFIYKKYYNKYIDYKKAILINKIDEFLINLKQKSNNSELCRVFLRNLSDYEKEFWNTDLLNIYWKDFLIQISEEIQKKLKNI